MRDPLSSGYLVYVTMMRATHTSVLVTGANGFVGKALCDELLRRELLVQGVTRKPFNINHLSYRNHLAELAPDKDWSSILKGVDVIVHLAARAHMLGDTGKKSEDIYLATNFLSTVNLARQAACAGVKRFVFISSIGVNGIKTDPGRAFTEQSVAQPQTPYAESKWLAEQELHKIARSSSMEIVILRPPLVYGQEPKGNFSLLLKLVQSGFPLPFGAIDNQKSFIFLGNLVDIIIRCLDHPDAAGKTYLVSDGSTISTPDMVRMLAVKTHSKAYVFKFPTAWIVKLLKLVGKSQVFEKLSDSLVIDSSKIERELDWRPPYTFKQGLAILAEWFVNNRKKS